MSKTWSVIVPTCRPDKFCFFLSSWLDLFKKHNVVLYVVEDNKIVSKDIEKALKRSGLNYYHFTHKDLPWFVPTGTDMIRSFGILQAYKNNVIDYCMTLDDDVLPESDYGVDIFDEYAQVFEVGSPYSSFFDVGGLTNEFTFMRGFPYSARNRKEVAVQYGGWSKNLDLNAVDQFVKNEEKDQNSYFFTSKITVPAGSLTTTCAMNMAWQNEYSPIMWQLPMIDGFYNRIGDIWSGLFIKKVLDANTLTMVINGGALVVHSRASDPFSNLKKEVLSLDINEDLWETLKIILLF